MNLKRGLRRLAIAVAVPYFGFCLVLAWSGFQKLRESAELEEIWRGNDTSWGRSALNSALELQFAGEAQLYRALGFGVIYPLIAVVLFLVARCIFRGFRQTEA